MATWTLLPSFRANMDNGCSNISPRISFDKVNPPIFPRIMFVCLDPTHHPTLDWIEAIMDPNFFFRSLSLQFQSPTVPIPLPPCPTAVLRIKKDIMNFKRANAYGITISTSEDDITVVHALITGPENTPYENGFFLFRIVFPFNYPNSALHVRILNTANDTVRFGPNIYNTGKICVSILNTWEGPNWTPEMNLTSTLISMQALLNAHPYFNEPGYKKNQSPAASQQYNKIVEHDTLIAAVCDIIERKLPIPDDLYAVALNGFRKHCQSYINKCEVKLSSSLSPMVDSFGEFRGVFQYKEILHRLQALKELHL